VDPDKFRDYGEPKEWDVSFSGILTNPYQPTLDDEPQTYIRKEIQREIFYTVGDLPLRKRPKYRDKELFWRAKPAGNITKWVNRLVHDVSPLPDEDYFRLLNRSRISLNTLSPVPTKMLSTRYFESFASNSLVLCPKSPLYDDLFTAGEHCVTFDRDLSEFTDKVEYYLEHDEERKQIAQRGHEHVLSNHTWEDRIETLPEHVDAL
jgi:spore maturation protein CgeB